jgi:hypothetical protein
MVRGIAAPDVQHNIFADAQETIAREEFQLWKLTVNPDHTATLTCEDGNGEAVYRKTNRHVPSEAGTLYVKFTADVVTEFLLLSFRVFVAVVQGERR